MTPEELDELLAGAEGLTLHRAGAPSLQFSRHDLLTPVALRGAMRRQRAEGDGPPPHLSAEQHDQVVRAMFHAAEGSEG